MRWRSRHQILIPLFLISMVSAGCSDDVDDATSSTRAILVVEILDARAEPGYSVF